MNLVVGATGDLGGMITTRLLQRGEPVRALVRQPSRYQELLKAGAEPVFGDLTDPDSLARACQGVERVITTATAPLPVRHREQDIQAVDFQGTRNLIDAAQAAGVAQFVYVSGFGFSPDAPQPLAKAKGLNEVYLQGCGMTYTILKPVLFMEAWIGFALGAQLQQGPSITVVGDGENKLAFVYSENVADLAVAVLGHPAAQNVTIPFSAPGSYSYRTVIKLIEQATGQLIAIRSIAPGEFIPGMLPLISELWALLAQMGDIELDTGEIARTYGINLLPVEDFIQHAFGSRVEMPVGSNASLESPV